jgi:hypothetical protein
MDKQEKQEPESPNKTPAGANPFERFEIRKIKRSQIRLASYNPRIITTEARKLLKDNIKRVGLLDPIIWNITTGNVVSGHQRLQQLDTLNGKKDDYELTVAAVELDEKTEIEQNIFMNNPMGQGEYDQVKLPDLLKEINADFAGFNAARDKAAKRENDMDFYLCLVFRNHEERKAFTDKYSLEDNMFVDPRLLEDQIIEGSRVIAP